MTNLTEQYRKGELPRNKVYYVKDFDEIFSCYLDGDNDFVHQARLIHPEVLGIVHTYDEYISLLSDSVAKTEGEEINAELKELLKRAKEILEDEGDYMIVQEIKQVLGEE